MASMMKLVFHPNQKHCFFKINSQLNHHLFYSSSNFVSKFKQGEPRNGADILVEALEREGVTNVFALPGGSSMEIHQALGRSNIIRNVLPRHEQGGIFAAEGYARVSGFPGVCITTSGPGATNIVTGLANAMRDSIPIVAITGQVTRSMLGKDPFQHTSIVDISRSITKHQYLVVDVKDIPRVTREAFYLASSGRPGPVLIDIPKDVQQQFMVPNWNLNLNLPWYVLPELPDHSLLEDILQMLSESKKPLLYVGGGCLNSSQELRRFVDLTGIPVATTLMGLGVYPSSNKLSLKMLGMYGSYCANYAVSESDLLLAFGVRFDNRVTGKKEDFASRAKVVHIDIDPTQIRKNKPCDVSVCADLKLALQALNILLESRLISKGKLDFGSWREELNEVKKSYPMSYKTYKEAISPQYAIKVLDELTDGRAIISTGVGQHQIWAAQWYNVKEPRQWLTSSGLGSTGFGLPAAFGAAVKNPDSIIVDIDGDGSFMMNIQELATLRAENLPVKVMIMNNQYLGMVAQWEDHYFKVKRAHSYLGNPKEESVIFPDMLKFAEACHIPAARVTKVGDLEEAIQTMLDTPGPYLLDVVVPHEEHLVPTIPGGSSSFKDLILTYES